MELVTVISLILMGRCRKQLMLKEGSSCFGGMIPGGVRGQTSCGRVSFGELRPQPSKHLTNGAPMMQWDPQTRGIDR